MNEIHYIIIIILAEKECSCDYKLSQIEPRNHVEFMFMLFALTIYH